MDKLQGKSNGFFLLNVFDYIGILYLRGVGVLPYRGYKSMCGPKGYNFSAVLVIKILIGYIVFGYGFCTLVLSCVGLEEATFLSLLIRS